MQARQWFRPPRHLVVLFVVVIVVPAAALAWLGWRLLEQDRALEGQRIQERLERAADSISAALERRLTEITDHLPALAASPPARLPDDSLIVQFGPHGVEAQPRGRLLYFPFPAPSKELPRGVFEAGEALEFRQQDYAKAAAVFQELARSKDPLIRVGALVRWGRNLRKNRRHQEALAVYDELERMGDVPAGDVPAELLARQARCSVLAEIKHSGLPQAAAALDADLQRGRWQLDRASYVFYSQEARRWLGGDRPAGPSGADRLALAAGVDWLAERWREMGQAGRPLTTAASRGRHSVWTGDRAVLVAWTATPQNLVALVGGPRYLEAQCETVWKGQGVAVALLDADGHRVLGQPTVAGKLQAVRAASDTALPWTLRVSSASPSDDFAQLAGRRRLLLAGLAVTAFLVLVSSYLIARALARELAVARLQSDFVSAVSHEFRSPLTSMCHLTEMLADGDEPGAERRRQYYQVLAGETRRLHRLVEGLLNFGRMEAGAHEYRFETLDPAELVREVVAEFQAQVAANGRNVALQINGSGVRVKADPEALSRALWNLLDNAVKYSPDGSTVWVEVGSEASAVTIRVRDQGVGIPVAERKRIFGKFVRGVGTKTSGVKGTGIGLTMAQHIVRAHGGHLRVESEPGRGSTFAILLPSG